MGWGWFGFRALRMLKSNNSFEDGFFLFFFFFRLTLGDREQIVKCTSQCIRSFFGLFEVSAGVFWSWEWVNRTDFFGWSWGMGGFRGHHVMGRTFRPVTTDGFLNPEIVGGLVTQEKYFWCKIANWLCNMYSLSSFFVRGFSKLWSFGVETTTTSLLDNPHINTWHLELQSGSTTKPPYSLQPVWGEIPSRGPRKKTANLYRNHWGNDVWGTKLQRVELDWQILTPIDKVHLGYYPID